MEYIEGMGRNPGEQYGRSHLYADTDDGLLPMCPYGWNRSHGEAFSIFRGHSGSRGTCKICLRRAAAGLPPVDAQFEHHRTKWL